eukprot:15406567-Alexandrium_andersonii.AAC.1
MSASLVGSEMCIRDSTRQDRDSCRRRAYHSRVQAKECSRQHYAAPATAVSYTHLTLPTICSV